MSLKESLIKHFGFTESDWEITAKYIHHNELEAKEYFLKEGKISDRIEVVKSGLLNFKPCQLKNDT